MERNSQSLVDLHEFLQYVKHLARKKPAAFVLNMRYCYILCYCCINVFENIDLLYFL